MFILSIKFIKTLNSSKILLNYTKQSSKADAEHCTKATKSS